MCLSLRLEAEALVLIRIVFSEAATDEEAVEDVVSLFFLLLFTKVSLSDNCIEMEDGISRMLQFPVLKKHERGSSLFSFPVLPTLQDLISGIQLGF